MASVVKGRIKRKRKTGVGHCGHSPPNLKWKKHFVKWLLQVLFMVLKSARGALMFISFRKFFASALNTTHRLTHSPTDSLTHSLTQLNTHSVTYTR